MLHCKSCSAARRTYLLRVIVNAMGNSHTHTRLFFKLQSAQTPSVEVWTTAFPHTPWVYLFRDPVEIMVSHLGSDPASARRPPCLRSRGHGSPVEVTSQLSGAATGYSSYSILIWTWALSACLRNRPLRRIIGTLSRWFVGSLRDVAIRACSGYTSLPHAHRYAICDVVAMLWRCCDDVCLLVWWSRFGSRVSNAEYCAAHLNYLNANPLKLIRKPGSIGRAVRWPF